MTVRVPPSGTRGLRLTRAATLASRLRTAANAAVAVIEPIDDHAWNRVPDPGTWSIGKEAEHLAEAIVYHLWIVRLTIGQKVSSRRPALERTQMTTPLSQHAAAELIHERAEDGARLLHDLTDEQLELPTRPPRATAQFLADAIDQILIEHIDSHRAEIEAKLRS